MLVPKHNETNCSDGKDNVLDENRNNEGGNDVCNDTSNVGKSCDGDNVMVTTAMALLTILVAMTAMMDLTMMKLTAAMAMTMFLVGTEKRRRQRCLQ
jgi:hypothetical protein